MMDSLLTPEARRHARLMAKAVAPAATRLERRFRVFLRGRRYNPAQTRALLAITPVAAARLRSLGLFLEQVEYNGGRLAKLNVSRAEIGDVLREFAGMVDEALEGQFQPAREQLQLATRIALENAFYAVRDAEARAFFALYRAELDATDLDDLLDRIVRVLTQAFNASAGRLLLPEGPLPRGLARPLYIEKGQPAEKWIDSQIGRRYASYWSYPLRSQVVVQFGFRCRYPWLPREVALLEAVGSRCLEAIERARLQKKVRRLEAEARHAEEEERRRIGRELHDEAGQSLLLLRLQLEMIERQAAEGIRPALADARGNVERIVQELRRIVAALSPAVLERLGLVSALRQLTARFRKVHPGRVRLRISGSSEPLIRENQEVVYRVAQECLQNVAKHSRATSVNLSLHVSDKSIRLSVSDNGTGFHAETARARPTSFGLAGMRERAALLGGTLAIRTAPGKGTVVTLELPRNARTGGS
jgi:signal transduction histidine kinase